MSFIKEFVLKDRDTNGLNKLDIRRQVSEKGPIAIDSRDTRKQHAPAWFRLHAYGSQISLLLPIENATG